MLRMFSPVRIRDPPSFDDETSIGPRGAASSPASEQSPPPKRALRASPEFDRCSDHHWSDDDDSAHSFSDCGSDADVNDDGNISDDDDEDDYDGSDDDEDDVFDFLWGHAPLDDEDEGDNGERSDEEGAPMRCLPCRQTEETTTFVVQEEAPAGVLLRDVMCRT